NGSTSQPQRSDTPCNPCQGVLCNSPPNAQCYVSPGTCAAGTCNYTKRPAGFGCSDLNACTANDACDANGSCIPGGAEPCTTPPPAFCSDPQTLVTYNTPGVCSPATGCSYTTASTSCTFGCNSTTHACNPNPCTGVSCTTPPNACYQTPGTCAAGACSYAFKNSGEACSDGNACTNGDTCNGTGTCTAGSPTSVDDNNVCTTDGCNTTTGSVTHTPVANGTNCDDADKCNGIATCQ